MLRSLVICLAVCAAPRVARADLLLGLDVGAELATATTALSGAQIERWSAQAPQALRRALVDASLLEAVNRAGAGRLDSDGALDPRDFSSFVALTEDGADYVLAFDVDSKLSFMLAKLPVPLASADPFAKARLRPLFRVLSDLGRLGLKPKDKDRYGNPMTWRGRSTAGGLWARYVPEADVVWLLLHPRGARR